MLIAVAEGLLRSGLPRSGLLRSGRGRQIGLSPRQSSALGRLYWRAHFQGNSTSTVRLALYCLLARYCLLALYFRLALYSRSHGHRGNARTNHGCPTQECFGTGSVVIHCPSLLFADSNTFSLVGMSYETVSSCETQVRIALVGNRRRRWV